MVCEGCKGEGRAEKNYAGLAFDFKNDKIIQLPQCPTCKGYIRD